MQILILTTVLSIMGSVLINTTNKSNSHFSDKYFKQHYLPVSSNLRLNKYEISNEDYALFLQDLKDNNQTALYHNFYPDTTAWISGDFKNKQFVSYYFKHVAYKPYPVVNVSFEGAKAYCKWLTAQYMALDKRPFKQVVFRLPTQAEWILAASNNNNSPYPWAGMYLINEKGQKLCNYRHFGDQYITLNEESGNYEVLKNVGDGMSFNETYTSPVNSFILGQKGFYNQSGNVAEMVAEQGIAMGGSFADPGYEVRNQSQQTYTQANPKIGFRVAMQIIEE